MIQGSHNEWLHQSRNTYRLALPRGALAPGRSHNVAKYSAGGISRQITKRSSRCGSRTMESQFKAALAGGLEGLGENAPALAARDMLSHAISAVDWRDLADSTLSDCLAYEELSA